MEDLQGQKRLALGRGSTADLRRELKVVTWSYKEMAAQYAGETCASDIEAVIPGLARTQPYAQALEGRQWSILSVHALQDMMGLALGRCDDLEKEAQS